MSPFFDDGLLLLPNAWDVLSARLAEAAGARAVGTSSAVLAWSRGYADGEQLPFEEVVAAVRSMTRVLRVPLTVDFERGYSNDASTVARHAVQLVEAGAKGINLEDAAGAASVLVEKIGAIRAVVPRETLFINARTCVVLRGVSADVDELVSRARLYERAGADGYFVPKLTNLEHIDVITRATTLRFNAVLVPGLATPAELFRAGVRRLSMGPRLGEVAFGAATEAVRTFLAGAPVSVPSFSPGYR